MEPSIVLTNLTAPTYDANIAGETIIKMHAISPIEAGMIIGSFAFMAYWYNKVSLDKEKYSTWVNPRGKIKNLYKIVRWGFWIYVAAISILAILQIVLTP